MLGFLSNPLKAKLLAGDRSTAQTYIGCVSIDVLFRPSWGPSRTRSNRARDSC